MHRKNKYPAQLGFVSVYIFKLALLLMFPHLLEEPSFIVKVYKATMYDMDDEDSISPCLVLSVL